MIAWLSAVVIGVALLVSGGAKLLRPAAGAQVLPRALSTGRRPLATIGALGIVESVIGVGVLGREPTALLVAQALLWCFVGWQLWSLAHGRTGMPCPCFGGHTLLGARSVGITLALAIIAGIAAGDHWFFAASLWPFACAVLLALCLLSMLVCLTLAREVARLRKIAGRPRVALELADEGPVLGSDCELIDRFPRREGELALAVFVSPSCQMCRELRPSIALVAAARDLELVVFDEQDDPFAWRAAEVPGSPYAVAMGANGRVLAKGTFNTLEQLQSVTTTARLRASGEFAYA